jgi:hypothetical protein
MAPPIIRKFTLVSRLPSSSSLVEIFAPPTIAATGRSGFSSTRLNVSISICMERPANAGSLCASPSVEACARCAAENASFT